MSDGYDKKGRLNLSHKAVLKKEEKKKSKDKKETKKED